MKRNQIYEKWFLNSRENAKNDVEYDKRTLLSFMGIVSFHETNPRGIRSSYFFCENGELESVFNWFCFGEE